VKVRDRLDEIIMEFYNKAGAFGKLDARGMAEAIFRHGVERAVADQENHGIVWNRLRCDTVQPEPVGETGRCSLGIYPVCGGRSGHGGHCQPDPDRRKGQRRKGLEKQLVGIASVGPFMEHRESLFCVSGGSGWGEWRTDRRSGKDRRK
jgi:hypothetical protein